VNAIGRVHSYLESLGIINLGAVQMPTPPSKTSLATSPPAKEKPPKKEAKPKSNRWTKAKEARAAKKEKELQREKERNEKEERKKKEEEGEGGEKEEKEDPRKTAWQTRREEASFDAGLEKERRKRKSARTEACLSKDGNQDTAGGYCGGSAVMCLMLPLPERITRFRAMEVLQVQQQETRRLQDRRSMAANR
jgi:outer membrane biosynthesis protein TonB